MPNGSGHPAQLIGRARSGDTAALDQLLANYLNYLQLVARVQLNSDLQVRVEPSDVVQEVMMVAARSFNQFRGGTEKELAAWLRSILVRKLADQIKRDHAQQRDVRREVPLEEALNKSSMMAQRVMAATISTPSGHAADREQAVLLAEALATLPTDYREVIILRNLEALPFSDVAERMGRSSNAVRQLWARAVERLRIDWKNTS